MSPQEVHGLCVWPGAHWHVVHGNQAIVYNTPECTDSRCYSASSITHTRSTLPGTSLMLSAATSFFRHETKLMTSDIAVTMTLRSSVAHTCESPPHAAL